VEPVSLEPPPVQRERGEGAEKKKKTGNPAPSSPGTRGKGGVDSWKRDNFPKGQNPLPGERGGAAERGEKKRLQTIHTQHQKAGHGTHGKGSLLVKKKKKKKKKKTGRTDWVFPQQTTPKGRLSSQGDEKKKEQNQRNSSEGGTGKNKRGKKEGKSSQTMR